MRTALRRARRLGAFLLVTVAAGWVVLRRRSPVTWIEPAPGFAPAAPEVEPAAEIGAPGQVPEDVLATDAGLTELPEPDEGAVPAPSGTVLVDEVLVGELLADVPADRDVDEAAFEQALVDAQPAPAAVAGDEELVDTDPLAPAPSTPERETSETDALPEPVIVEPAGAGPLMPAPFTPEPEIAESDPSADAPTIADLAAYEPAEPAGAARAGAEPLSPDAADAPTVADFPAPDPSESARTGSAGAGSAGAGSAGAGSAGAGSAGAGSAGAGSAGAGSAGAGSAGTGSARTGLAGTGSAGAGSARTGSAGTGSAGTGSAGAGSARTGLAGTGSAGTESGGAGSVGEAEVAGAVAEVVAAEPVEAVVADEPSVADPGEDGPTDAELTAPELGIDEPTMTIARDAIAAENEETGTRIPMPTFSEAPTMEIPAVTDDLRAVRGIGPSMERMLHGLGIISFRQLAMLDGVELERVRAELSDFRTRIEREDWVGQARDLHREKYGREPGSTS